MAYHLPVVVVGIGVATFAKWIYSKKNRCCQCSSKFSLTVTCPFCKESVCRTCGEELLAFSHQGTLITEAGRYCIAHRADMAEYINKAIERIDIQEKARSAFLKKRAFAEQCIDQVELFPMTYRGRLPPPKHGMKLKTSEFKNRLDAERELKVLALMEDIDCVLVQQKTLIEGSYNSSRRTHTTWRAEGLI